MRATKYHARKTAVGGIVFDSAAEARRWQELQLLERAGKISSLRRQPRFTLLEAFTHRGKRYRAITYTADFSYQDLETGEIVVEDVKGVRTRDYQMRKKMFIRKYPELSFRETRR